MPNVETSQTVLLIISPKHFYGLCNHTHPAIVKKTIPNKTKPPYTVYLYVRKPKRGEDMAYIEVNDGRYEVKMGSPLIKSTEELKPNCIPICGSVAGKCLCEDFQVMPCSSQGRERYAKDVGMTPNQLLDMSGNKDMGVWYVSDIEIMQTPKQLTEFGLAKPPQNWCYLLHNDMR